jgi:hypothetical protein
MTFDFDVGRPTDLAAERFVRPATGGIHARTRSLAHLALNRKSSGNLKVPLEISRATLDAHTSELVSADKSPSKRLRSAKEITSPSKVAIDPLAAMTRKLLQVQSDADPKTILAKNVSATSLATRFERVGHNRITIAKKMDKKSKALKEINNTKSKHS